MKTKKSATRMCPHSRHPILWFIGIYLASILAFGLFHELSQWFIHVLSAYH